MKGPLSFELERLENGWDEGRLTWVQSGRSICMGEFDVVVIIMLHCLIADVVCLRPSKMCPVIQVRLRSVAFSESDDDDCRTNRDMQIR